MHNRRIVVGCHQTHVILPVEIVLRILQQVLLHDQHVTVSICARMLVPHAYKMADLVYDHFRLEEKTSGNPDVN